MNETRIRQARYKNRCNAAGLVQISAWVPANRTRDMLKLAEVLREETGKLLPLDPSARAMEQQLSLDLPSP